MIRIRKHKLDITQDLELEEFERLVRRGEIGPHVDVCFPLVTGEKFVRAKELEIFRGLYQTGPITFRRHFNLARAPWLTLSVIAILCATYWGWQESTGASTEELLRKGAKSRSLMIELGQWWRLISANFLHVSGWHLAVNAIFLFNLGGPVEAVFRRFDYLLILFFSAIGSTLASTLINPTLSCGASGIVFGVWGAAAIFGVRYRSLLPEKYRRYFIGSVIPYSIFVLYFGIVMPGIDNWAHLGGLVAGASVALFMPSRLLAPKDPFITLKITLLGLTLLAISIASSYKLGPGPLTQHRYFARNGLEVPIPQRWFELVSHRNPKREAHAFHNRAGVVIGLETSLEKHPVDLESATHQFIQVDLAAELEVNQAQGARILDPVELSVGGFPANRIRTEIMTPKTIQHADYYIIARGYYLYILSLSAPKWLAQDYKPVMRAVLKQTKLIAPDALEAARSAVLESDNPATQAHLGKALILAGKPNEGWAVLESAMQRWPAAGEPSAIAAQMHHNEQTEPKRACRLIIHALEHREWTPQLITLAHDLLENCNEPRNAARVIAAGLERFPKNKVLKEHLIKNQAR